MSEPKIKKEQSAKKYFYFIIGPTIIFWALAFPFIKIGLTELSSVNLTIMRLFIVCIVFLLFRFLKPQKFSKLYKKDIIPIFLLGFLGIIVYHLGLNYGEVYISASAASLIIATIPIFIVILAAIVLKEKITNLSYRLEERQEEKRREANRLKVESLLLEGFLIPDIT